MTSYQREALRLLSAYTAGTFDVYRMAGGARATCRQHVLTTLLNAPKRLPQAACGVNAIRAAFWALSAPTGDCLAAREDSFAEWARTALERFLEGPKVEA